jgi:hypothetical protein
MLTLLVVASELLEQCVWPRGFELPRSVGASPVDFDANLDLAS